MPSYTLNGPLMMLFNFVVFAMRAAAAVKGCGASACK